MKIYFSKLEDLWLLNRKTFPQVPYIDNMPKIIYKGIRNQSDYIEWKPIDNKEYDFRIIEEELGFSLHSDIKEYFTSYWFLRMDGLINNIEVSLTPITPLVDIKVFIIERYKISLKQGRDVKNIEIGFVEFDDADGFLLLVDNVSGKVEWLDPEKEESGFVSESLYKLITDMEPRC